MHQGCGLGHRHSPCHSQLCSAGSAWIMVIPSVYPDMMPQAPRGSSIFCYLLCVPTAHCVVPNLWHILCHPYPEMQTSCLLPALADPWEDPCPEPLSEQSFGQG